MAREKIRIGIIGVGQIGKHHLKDYDEITDAEMVAAADVDPDELERVAEKHNIPYRTADFRELLARDDIDAVDVCLHNNYHMAVTVAALEAGKHVFCEKPIAGAYVDGMKMLETAAACGRKLSIQLSTLFSKETRIAKYLIDNGRLGRLYHARSTGYRRRGRPYVDGYGSQFFVSKETAAGGALYDMGVYHIAQILYLLGLPDVERISGKTYQEVAMDDTRRQKSGYNVEELGLGFVKCAGGVTVDILEAWAIHLNAFDGSCIVGSKGGIRLDPFSFHSVLDDLEANTTFDMKEIDYRWHKLRDNEDGYDSPQHHWIAALQGRVELLPCAEAALSTMLISEGIYLSDKLGREVTAEEVIEASVSTALTV